MIMVMMIILYPGDRGHDDHAVGEKEDDDDHDGGGDFCLTHLCVVTEPDCTLVIVVMMIML